MKELVKKSFNIAYVTAFLLLLPTLLAVAQYSGLKPGIRLMLFGVSFFLFVLLTVWITVYRILKIKHRSLQK